MKPTVAEPVACRWGRCNGEGPEGTRCPRCGWTLPVRVKPRPVTK